MGSKAELVEQIKHIQRSDPDKKQAWWDYCDTELGGIRDPNKHDESVLMHFLSRGGGGGKGGIRAGGGGSKGGAKVGGGSSCKGGNGAYGGKGGYGGDYGGGKGGFWGYGGMPPPMYMMGAGMDPGKPDLPQFIKTGQKISGPWKEAWQAFCQTRGTKFYDPARCEEGMIREFVDYVGQCVLANLDAEGNGGSDAGDYGYGKRKPIEDSPGPTAKRAKGKGGYGYGGDPHKAELVERVKDYQRRDEASKKQWWEFTDQNYNGIRDPARHDINVLEEFLNTYE